MGNIFTMVKSESSKGLEKARKRNNEQFNRLGTNDRLEHSNTLRGLQSTMRDEKIHRGINIIFNVW